MAKRKTDIPFNQDPASRLMPWIVAVMVYIAGLALAGAFVLSAFADRWEAGLTGSLTIQIPPPSDEALSPDVQTQKVEAALNVLRGTKGVSSAKALATEEINLTLSGPYDDRTAIVSIPAGAGGTDAADWAEMLMRLYTRWTERNGMESAIMDLQQGEEAGIKGATIEVKGDYAYGFLKAEAGVHRLVRISPFDTGNRRHTAFASVFVYPEVDSDIEVDLKDEDLKVETYRSGGAGGQHVNKTSSAVRISHLPTGIVVQCQNERSQFKNKATALKVLSARVYQHFKDEEQKKLDAVESAKKSIDFGNQIRSYVFHPYNLVKDHRTDHETANVQAVMDGNIDGFIKAYLTWDQS